jgi:hypothetical protein
MGAHVAAALALISSAVTSVFAAGNQTQFFRLVLISLSILFAAATVVPPHATADSVSVSV